MTRRFLPGNDDVPVSGAYRPDPTCQASESTCRHQRVVDVSTVLPVTSGLSNIYRVRDQPLRQQLLTTTIETLPSLRPEGRLSTLEHLRYRLGTLSQCRQLPTSQFAAAVEVEQVLHLISSLLCCQQLLLVGRRISFSEEQLHLIQRLVPKPLRGDVGDATETFQRTAVNCLPFLTKVYLFLVLIVFATKDCNRFSGFPLVFDDVPLHPADEALAHAIAAQGDDLRQAVPIHDQPLWTVVGHRQLGGDAPGFGRMLRFLRRNWKNGACIPILQLPTPVIDAMERGDLRTHVKQVGIVTDDRLTVAAKDRERLQPIVPVELRVDAGQHWVNQGKPPRSHEAVAPWVNCKQCDAELHRTATNATTLSTQGCHRARTTLRCCPSSLPSRWHKRCQ